MINYCIFFRHVCSAHLNPVVSIGLWIGGCFSGKELLPYIIAQLVGGNTAVAYLKSYSKGNGEHSPVHYNLVSALVTEIVMISSS